MQMEGIKVTNWGGAIQGCRYMPEWVRPLASLGNKKSVWGGRSWVHFWPC